MTPAQWKRNTSVGMLVELYCPDEQDTRLFDVTRDEIADNILKLAQLGRTDRWIARINQWANMVRDENNSLRWAFYQGMIWVNYAI